MIVRVVHGAVWPIFGGFLHRTYRVQFPSTLTAPHLWRGGNRSTQGAVHHFGSVRLVRLKPITKNIYKKKKFNPHQTIQIFIKKKKHIHNIS